jgi:hypothetical protein
MDENSSVIVRSTKVRRLLYVKEESIFISFQICWEGMVKIKGPDFPLQGCHSKSSSHRELSICFLVLGFACVSLPHPSQPCMQKAGDLLLQSMYSFSLGSWNWSLTLQGIRAPYIHLHLHIFNHRMSSMGLDTSNKVSLHSPWSMLQMSFVCKTENIPTS